MTLHASDNSGQALPTIATDSNGNPLEVKLSVTIRCSPESSEENSNTCEPDNGVCRPSNCDVAAGSNWVDEKKDEYTCDTGKVCCKKST